MATAEPLSSGVPDGVADALGLAAGGAEIPVPSLPPTATAAPTPTSTTAVPAAAIVCARLQTNPGMDRFPVTDLEGQLAPGRPWHILNFLPDPQGHGALRPTPSYSLVTLAVVVATAPSSPGAE